MARRRAPHDPQILELAERLVNDDDSKTYVARAQKLEQLLAQHPWLIEYFGDTNRAFITVAEEIIQTGGVRFSKEGPVYPI